MKTSEPHQLGGGGERLLSLFWRKPADSLAERTRRRVTLHLIPYLFFLYILAYLDRVNVSVAQVGMLEPPGKGGLGFDLAIFGFGAGLFFVGYWILEIPSTVSIVRWGARWVFVRILVLWGICATLVGAIGTPFAASLFAWLPQIPENASFLNTIDSGLNHLFGWLVSSFGSSGPIQVASGTARFVNRLHDTAAYQFYFFRFMLGFFEGGFFPSVIFYLSYWFRDKDRAKAIAAFMAAIPLSTMVGLPASGLLLGINWFNIPGWRWILILEGIAPILAGFATLFFLPDRPAQAKWLPADERGWLMAELEREHKGKQGHGHGVWLRHLGMVLLLTCVYFGLNFSSYGLSMFMPRIIQAQTGGSGQMSSFLASLPYAMAFLGMLINGRHSDRTGERIWHVAVPLALLSLGISLAAALDGLGVLPVLVMIFFVGPFMYAHLPAFWPIPTMYLGAIAAASAIGFINMIGNLGGFFGPTMVGKAATNPALPALHGSLVGFASAPGEGPLLAISAHLAHAEPGFARALLLLAPWPLASAAIIVIAGYARRTTQQKNLEPNESPAPQEAGPQVT
jgi:MFS transporter, ACS family, tartrate transporter